jgi:PadR family transcriptional regulator PadR
MSAFRLGPLERLILLAVIQCAGNAYGITIQRAIEEVTGKPLSVPQLYTALNRLVEKGALSCRRGAPTRVRGGKAKQLYSVTYLGHAALKEADMAERERAEALRLLEEPKLDASRNAEPAEVPELVGAPKADASRNAAPAQPILKGSGRG